MIDIDIVLFGRIVKSPKILTFMQIIEWTALRSLLNYECDSLINIDFTDDDNEKIPLVGSLMIGGECRQHTNTHCNWHETHRQVSVDNLTLEVHAMHPSAWHSSLLHSTRLSSVTAGHNLLF